MLKFLLDIFRSVVTYLVFAFLLFVITFSFATKQFPPDLTKMHRGIDSMVSLVKIAQDHKGASGGAVDFEIGNMAETIEKMNKKNADALNELKEFNNTPQQVMAGPGVDRYKERFEFLEKQNQQIILKIDRIENYLANLHSRTGASMPAANQPRAQDPAVAAALAAAALAAKTKATQIPPK